MNEDYLDYLPLIKIKDIPKHTEVLNFEIYITSDCSIWRIPIIKCYKISYCQCAFYCSHCKKIHKHGLGNGHRSAHCNKENSPFEITGYSLEVKT
jgi:hypothetical protein